MAKTLSSVERQARALRRKEIGKRIRDLREASSYGNRSLAAAVGVGERAVAAWIEGGGISYDHAKAVADLFDRSVHWLLTGQEQSQAPEDLSERLDRIEEGLARLQETLGPLAAAQVADGVARANPASGQRSSTKGNAKAKRAAGG